MADHVWTGWGRKGKCIPIPSDRLAEWECFHCERPIIPGASDPDEDCPYPDGPFKPRREVKP